MRAFLAIDLPEEVRAGVHALAERHRRSLPGWRWVSPSAYHLTVRFLGEVDAALLGRAIPPWRRDLSGIEAPEFEVSGVGAFPGAGPPRVLWIGAQESPPAGRFDAIFRSVEATCRTVGLEAETRPFHPHLTLARAARDGRPRLPAGPDEGSWGPIRATEVVLFRSDLLPGGACYTPLERFPLGGDR